MPAPPERSNASASLIVGLAATVILALGVGVLVYTRQASPPAPVPSPVPSAAAAAAPSAVPVLGAEAPAASPDAQRPAAIPSAAPSPPARAARRAAKPPAKVEGSPRVAEAPAPAAVRDTPALALQKRSFVPSRTASENIRGVSKSLTGFDSQQAKDVKLKRAPEVEGRIEFSTSPVKVKPGDKYKVRVSLLNEGKRPIEIKEVEFVLTVNRKLSSVMVKPLVKQVAARQNEVIHEHSGTWDKNTTSFTVGVRVMSERLDLYRNQLVWK